MAKSLPPLALEVCQGPKEEAANQEVKSNLGWRGCIPLMPKGTL